MSHTYASNRVHVVFSTKDRKKNLADDLQPKLWGYMKGIARNHGFEVVKNWRDVRSRSRSPRCASSDAAREGGAVDQRLFVEMAQ